MFLIGIFIGCDGPMGQPGENIVGLDVTPPTIALVEPWPLDQVWDNFKITLASVDNVSIREVHAFINGAAIYKNLLLVKTAPPYEFQINADAMPSGWNYISARAYDVAGNFTDLPVTPIRVGFSNQLVDTVVVLKYHSVDKFREWVLPDTAKSEIYWSSFTIAKPCSLRALTLNIGGTIADTATVDIGIWRGGITPTQRDTVFRISSVELNPDQSQELRLALTPRPLYIQHNFFISIGYSKIAPGDSILIGLDDGMPFWNRSGSRDADGWHKLSSKYGVKSNLIITAEVHYGF